jgi:hypothetical protein
MKIFEFHNSIFKRLNYRPYYRGTWDPLRMEMFRLLPFQYEKSAGENFQIYHVKDAVETDITSYFDGDNCITGWTLAGGGTFTGCDYQIYSFVPNASDYIESNAIGLTEGDKIHFSISGTFPSSDVRYALFRNSASDYVAEITGTEEEFTYTAETTDVYYMRCMDTGSANADITNGVPKLALTTLDIHGNYVTYNGGNLFTTVPRGQCYFKIDDGNGLYSEDCNVDCVNFWLSGWPSYYTNIVNDPVTFTKDGKDVTLFHAFDYISGGVTYQSPLSNSINVQKGEVVRMAFRQVTYEYWTNASTSAPVCYFKYSDGTLVTGSVDFELNPITGNREGNIIITKFTALKTGSGQIYLTPTSSVDTSFVYCDVYKSYSDRCITISIASTVDFGGTYYKGGFTQKLYKEATVQRSPGAKITIVGDEKNGMLVKEKITTANRFVMVVKVTETEFEALVEASSGTWTIVDQCGRSFTAYNIEIEDPVWNQGNGTCRISFDSNISTFSYNNASL